MTVEVWWGGGSPYAWRVLLALEAKGVPYTGHLISFSAREHRSEAFLARNPRGKVPVLRHGETVVYESSAILAYLEAAFPGRPLLGRTPTEVGLVWQRMQEADLYGWAALKGVVYPFFFGWKPERADEVRQAVPAARAELGRLEDAVGIRSFAVGDALTAADLAWYPFLACLERVLRRPECEALDLGFGPIDEQYPAIARLMEGVEALEGFARTWPPHWGEPNAR